MRKYLFICCTPLQGFIAKRIIETEQLEKSQCILFFYTSFDNEVYRKSFAELNKLCSESLYYVWKPNFPKYIFKAKIFFRKYQFSRFYFASIDSIFVQIAISQYNTKHIGIYTFDDGSANIVSSSRYYQKQKLSFKRVIFILLGNRFSSQKIKKLIKIHYTIYPNQKNISSNTVALDLFKEGGFNKNEKKLEDTKCIVILGTVYEEALKDPNDIDVLKRFFNGLVSQTTAPIYYIPHPREKQWSLQGIEKILSPRIAEEIIISLLNNFSKICIYSLGSTAQLNLASIDGIENIFLKLPNEYKVLKEIRNIERKITNKDHVTLNL